MTRRIFVTGAGGFIGRATADLLRALGHEVIAVVRDPATAPTSLSGTGVWLVAGDLTSAAEIREAMAGSDGVIHLAGSYRVGISARQRPAMHEANVAVTERVLDAAIAEGVERIVAVSTVNVLGNTHGAVPDETHRRDLAEGFVSYYDETKYRAHVAAEARIAAGAPIIIAMPGTVYGRGDHSGIGAQLKAAYDGTARYVALGSLGITPVHVDDVAAGIVGALDRGRIGESYVIAGEPMRLSEAMGISADAAGVSPPRRTISTRALRLAARLGPGLGAVLGLDPNLAEIVRAADGVTYWASHAKAAAELGFAPRALEIGARDAFGQPGRSPRPRRA
jgi:nucleoside-diphosphate-sugar epimerase